MEDSYFFYAVDLLDRPITDEATARRVLEAVAALGDDGFCDEDLTRRDHALEFACRGPGDMEASLSFAAEEPEWGIMVPDVCLRQRDGRPDTVAQSAVVDVIRAVVEIVPPYLGTAVWPFGPADPEIYDASRPFRLRQVGSVMYLGERYLDTQLDGADLSDAPVARREEVAGGVLLVAGEDLRVAPEDGDLDDLAHYLDEQHAR